MLHILWLILKFILILLGIVLGLILLAVLLLLFCPVRYRAFVAKEESGWKEIRGSGSVSWLFRGVSLKAEWKDGKLQTAFYLFGIPVSRILEKRREKNAAKAVEAGKKEKTAKAAKKTKAAKTAKTEHDRSTIYKSTDDSQNNTESSAKNNINNHTENNGKETVDAENGGFEKMAEAGMTQQQKISEKPCSEMPDITGTGAESAEKTGQSAGDAKEFRLKKVTASVQNKIRGIWQKLKNFHKTLQKIRSNVNWWKTFLEHPRVKAALSLVWKHAKFLLKHIFPTRTEGKIIFSSEDPAVSGTVLAVLGMTIPFHKNCVEIVPLFNGENYLRGNISARGRIYGFVFVRAAVVIYFDKNIKYVIKRWKTRRA